MAANTDITPPVRAPVAPRRMLPSRRISLAVGILYVITFVSIPTLGLYAPIKNDVGAFILGAGSTTALQWGALSEVTVGLAGIATAVVLYPLTKRISQTAALGLVAARLLETCLIFVSVVNLLTMTTLRHDLAGTNRGALTTLGHSLLANYNWTFLLSQSLMPVACDLLLGYLLYRSAIVPRVFPIVAFIGAPLLLASDIAVFFGAYPQVSPIAALAALPVALFELSLGLWLIIRGFKQTPLTAAYDRPVQPAAS